MSDFPLILLVILVPLALGALNLILGRRLTFATKLFGLVGTAVALIIAIQMWRAGDVFLSMPDCHCWGGYAGMNILKSDGLSIFMLNAACFIGLLIVLYSLGSGAGSQNPGRFYGHMLIALGCSAGALLAANFVVLAIFWGFMGLPFYLLINMGKDGAETAGKKMFIITGASDSFLLLGIGLLLAAGVFPAVVPGSPSAATGLLAGAFLCLTAAAFAKAGGMPLHSWIPDVAETAPIPVVAFLPAAADKLLGIYLLVRVSWFTFTVVPGTWLSNLLMILGAVTIVAAVTMALVQHNLRRLLGFHAVSQVGYMILGIGTGSLLGVAGGLFHMLNNAIYKSCLFLTAGAAERRAGTSDLDKMGGLYKALPVTFLAAVISALAISGLPPLNGFFSKWMIYQAVIGMGSKGGFLWIILLVAAVFGSALTLASFVKVIHSVFLGSEYGGADKPPAGPKASPLMKISVIVLAFVCVFFGVFALQIPLGKMILPAIGGDEMVVQGWNAPLATILIILAIVVGLIIYAIGKVSAVRRDDNYVGGAPITADMRFSAGDFYQTISEMPVLRRLYIQAQKSWYDFYDLGRRLTFYLGRALRALHSGLLLTYVAWCVLGLVVLMWYFFVLAKG